MAGTQERGVCGFLSILTTVFLAAPMAKTSDPFVRTSIGRAAARLTNRPVSRNIVSHKLAEDGHPAAVSPGESGESSMSPQSETACAAERVQELLIPPQTTAARETFEHRLPGQAVHRLALWLAPATGNDFALMWRVDS